MAAADALNGTFAEMLVDGHRLLPVLLDDMRAAQRDIHVAMFLFFRDPIGLEVAGVLCDRARAGVKVRVLLNATKIAMGDPFSSGEKEMMDQDPNVDWSPLDVGPLCDQLRAAGAEVHDTNIDYDAPVPAADERLRAMAEEIREGIDVDELHVDHRKIIVVDGRVGYTGGANIGAQYLSHGAFDPAVETHAEADAWRRAGSREPWWMWHDSLTRFEGPVVGELDAHFRDRWILDGGTPFALEGPLPRTSPPRGIRVDGTAVLVNEPSRKANAVRALYLDLIESSERSIFLESPYFYHPSIVDALVRAKTQRPQLEVTLIVPAVEWNDNPYAQDAQEHHYPELLACGIAVHEYQNHFTHLKLAVFDERWSIHGSTNLNFRSLEDDKDFELVVLVDGRELARHLLAHVRDVDLRTTRKITPADVGASLAGLRVRIRDPRTVLLVSQKVL